jgi:hypothetical protein
MKRNFSLFLYVTMVIVLGSTAVVVAVDGFTSFIVGAGEYLAAKDTASARTIGVLGVNSSGNTEVNAATGETVVAAVAKTPLHETSSTGVKLLVAGESFNYAPGYVPTLVATPVDGTNVYKPGLNIVPTVAANAVGCLPAVPTPGDTFTIVNANPNAVRAKACSTPGVNGGAAGTYISIATKARADCVAESATSYFCSFGVVPTPAGP